jgi:hypothetical protein
MGANVMYLKGGTRDHFLHFIAEQFPDRLDGYRRMYPGAYAPKSYVATVRGLIASLRDRYDVARRTTRIAPAVNTEEPAPLPAEEQTTFVWN